MEIKKDLKEKAPGLEEDSVTVPVMTLPGI